MPRFDAPTRRKAALALVAAVLAGCQTAPMAPPPAIPPPVTAPGVSAPPAAPEPPLAAAPKPPPRLPRIGLALGGGAARGFAHIGVIQVLEENGIHPDLVAGTSAGSLVAALYASGKSGAEMGQLALAMDEVRSPTGLIRCAGSSAAMRLRATCASRPAAAPSSR